ncbi:bifunctional hydroxymethylpyrimidine kinase/phosphomethylpyrimidine kinase [Candidatus Micrarchaeota archaeon]|nr:bifunctional hydroxymethylpyrimidine kinase/phosphomethylpyrimidine kinase [Candidatus Micrarchaeota archaeon]
MQAVALAIGGSDPSAGAGIQADLKVFSKLGVYTATAITAITIQNTIALKKTNPLPSSLVQQQLRIILEDFNVKTIKTGMLPTVETINAVAHAIRKSKTRFVIVDPVMSAQMGGSLVERKAVKAIRSLLLPLATIITPNALEAQCLLQSKQKISTIQQAKLACIQLQQLGAKNVVLKGMKVGEENKGMRVGEEKIVDVLLLENGEFVLFEKKRIKKGTKGGGCAFASAIAAFLTKGKSVKESVALAEKFVSQAIERGGKVGKGIELVNLL